MFHKIIAILACFVLFPITHSKAIASTGFVDVPAKFWAYAEITSVTGQGYMSGDAESRFYPNQPSTRLEAARAIAKSITIEVPTNYQTEFTDIPTSHPDYNEIRELAYGGIIQNTSYFLPNQSLTRSHIAKMMALAYKVEVDSKNVAQFKDYPATYWAKNYIESLADVGLIKGVTTTKFSPTTYVTRAQLAAFIVRGQDFQQSVANNEMIYDYLSKHYLVTTNHYRAWTNEVVKLVNEQRALSNFPALEEDPDLTQLSIIKAQDMVKRDYFEHNSPFYGNPWDMASIFDYEYTSFGENIARNFNSPKTVVNAWMNSEKHRENILRTNYVYIGVGLKKDASGNYIWVQHFASK